MVKKLTSTAAAMGLAASCAAAELPCKSVSVKKLPAYELAYVEYRGHYENNPGIYDKVLEPLLAWAVPNRLWSFPSSTKLIIIYPDSEAVPAAEKRMWMAITIPSDAKPPKGIRRMTLKEGLYAVGDFEISPHEFGRAWGFMYRWLSEQGYAPSDGYPFELKKNDSDEHREHKHLVEICVPVAKVD